MFHNEERLALRIASSVCEEPTTLTGGQVDNARRAKVYAGNHTNLDLEQGLLLDDGLPQIPN